MDALGSVREDEVLVFHCQLNGDCQEPDGRHSERSTFLSCSNQPMVPNQNGRAFRPNFHCSDIITDSRSVVG